MAPMLQWTSSGLLSRYGEVSTTSGVTNLVKQSTCLMVLSISVILIGMRYRRPKYDWIAIQKYYDDGHTWRELTSKFGVAQSAVLKAIRVGRFKSTRNQSAALAITHLKGKRPKHTLETKKKISESRIRYLMAHPDKVPYRINHSSKKSWPEQVFENALVSSGIDGWKYAFQHGIYEYDFAWPEQKIDVEIDGATHKTEKVVKIDKRRDAFSKERGWKVIRFEASRVKRDVIGCINELKTIL